MGILGNLATSGVEAEDKDTLGGGGFLVPTGVYPCTIDMAYLSKAKSGAMAVNLHLKTDTGALIRETTYITNRNGENFYVDKKDGTKRALPGFNTMNALSELAAGKPLTELDNEKKVINLYNYDAKGEVPTPVEALTDLIGQNVQAAIFKVKKNKQQDDGTGKWVDATDGSFREINEVDKFFDADTGKTLTETKANAEATFKDEWLKKNDGKDKDLYKAPKGTVIGAPTNGGAVAPEEDLFA